jgi:AraC-like DNA-binding protein
VDGLPLRDYELVHAADPDYAREMIGRILAPHQLNLIKPHVRLDARLHCCRLADTAMSFCAYGGDVVTVGLPGDFFAVVVPLSGTSRFEYRRARLVLTPSTGCVISPSDDVVTVRLHHDSAHLHCRIERSALEAHLAAMLGECLSEPLRFEPGLRLDQSNGLGLSQRVRGLVRDIDRRDPGIERPRYIRDAERALMTHLLLAQPHNYSSALEDDARPASSREVRHAVALMESDPGSPLSLASVASALNVSGRSLQRRFRQDVGVTFRRVLHDIRLRRAHDDLVRSAPGSVSVNEVFARWGLPLEGYSYVAYRNRYHESPAQTLRRFSEPAASS